MMPKKPQTTQQSQMPPKKVYSREFKLETLRLLRSSGKTKADLERELGLYPGQIRLWEKAFNRKGENVEQAFPGTGHQSDAEAELRQLRRENEILRQERDILKKAVAYGHSPVFSKTQDQN
jgi:transposase